MIDGEVLVIGLGSIGERHVRNMLTLGHQNISVLRRSATPPRTLKGDEFRTITNVDEAFQRKPQFVIIATPNSLHTPFLERSIKQGIDVLVEVPLAHSLDKLDQLQLLSQETNSEVMIGHNIRFHPLLERIYQAVQEETIGKVLYSRSQFGEYLPDCHHWEDYRNRYEARADLGGGVILTSIHEIDHAYWLFGPIKAVTCIAKQCHLDITAEDLAMLILEHESGILSEITLDFVQRIYRRSLQIAGSMGTLEWELRDNHLRYFNSEQKAWEDLQILNPNYDFNQTYLEELKHCFQVVQRKVKPLNNLADGIHVLTAGLSALKSSTSGQRIEL